MSKVADNFKTTISLHPEEYEVLRFLAFKQKTSVAGVVRGLITKLETKKTLEMDVARALQEEGGVLTQYFKKQLGS